MVCTLLRWYPSTSPWSWRRARTWLRVWRISSIAAESGSTSPCSSSTDSWPSCSSWSSSGKVGSSPVRTDTLDWPTSCGMSNTLIFVPICNCYEDNACVSTWGCACVRADVKVCLRASVFCHGHVCVNTTRITRNLVGLPKMMTAVVRWITTTFGNIYFKFSVCHVILLKSGPYDYHIYLRTTRFPN